MVATEDDPATGSANPPRTADGHHIVVDGRKWRATDPGIPDKLRQELVDELMAARRGVRAGESDARPRVNDAKHALGERGYAWWEEPAPDELDTRITATIHALLRKRDGKTICPSDVARVVGGPDEQWRSRMDDVRRVAAGLAADGTVVITQKGEPVDLATVRGPVRIAFGPSAS
ncbi:DUF3253 domain-containing protein [Microbacterium gorillae]|uniref:DUF3253 domain-containing protein n=1 Tax=Microbacterium gorillae TaxID=1231063 RepID=UPI00058E89EF|nr:DUF3253 domain-containing protein [Microbacterium gorillae]